jgi:hypothetical protein
MTGNEWQTNDINTFWGEIAKKDHLVQVYEDQKILLDSLEGFVGTGFLAGNSVIIVATADHLSALERRLLQHGFDLASLIATDQYIPLNAENLLSTFMVNGWPDEDLFMQSAKQLLIRARRNKRPVRAFGEMVALLWSAGCKLATIKVEELWNNLCSQEEFCIYCAYPQSIFNEKDQQLVGHICKNHTKEIGGWSSASTEIFHRSIC